MSPRSIRIAIAGAGNVGSFVAKDLRAKGHEVVVIEQNEALIASLKDELDVSWVRGTRARLHTLDARPS